MLVNEWQHSTSDRWEGTLQFIRFITTSCTFSSSPLATKWRFRSPQEHKYRQEHWLRKFKWSLVPSFSHPNLSMSLCLSNPLTISPQPSHPNPSSTPPHHPPIPIFPLTPITSLPNPLTPLSQTLSSFTDSLSRRAHALHPSPNHPITHSPTSPRDRALVSVRHSTRGKLQSSHTPE